MGGAVAVIGAAHIPELTAAVTFYGLPPEQAVKPADVKVPLQGHFANRDDWVAPKVVDGFEQGLKAAGKDFEFFRYDADHAFVNELPGGARPRGRRTRLGAGDGVLQEAFGVANRGDAERQAADASTGS